MSYRLKTDPYSLTVRMMNKPRNISSTSQRHLERITAQARLHMLVHSPADHLPCRHVLDGCHIQPPLFGGAISDIGKPDGWTGKAVQDMPYSPEGFLYAIEGRQDLIQDYAQSPEQAGEADYTLT